MRLLFLTQETHPTHRVDVAVLFAKFLPRLSVFSDLVAGARDPQSAAAPWQGGDAIVATVGGGNVGRFFRTLAHRIRALLRARQSRYDAFLVRDLPLPAVFALVVARLRDIPFIYWMSYPIPEGLSAYAREAWVDGRGISATYALLKSFVLRVLLDGLVLRYADHVFVQSRFMLDDLVGRGVPSSRMTPVPMGVDLESIAALNVRARFDPWLRDRIPIAYVGSLHPTRRLDMILEAMPHVLDRIPSVGLVMVGDSDDPHDRQRLEALADHLGIAHAIRWTGWVPMDIAWEWTRACRIGLSIIPRGPLFDCSSPTKVVEYLALGIPALVNDLPDQMLVARESGAARVAPMTPEGIAKVLIEMIGDEPALARMAAAGPPWVAAHRSYEALARIVAGTLHGVVGPRPPSVG